MRLVVQRVSRASVSVSEKVITSIDSGFLAFLGITGGDTKNEADFLAKKLSKLRIMNDSDGKMNLSLSDAKGSLLIVSQFTLYGDATRGNRPSFMNAARPKVAKPLYEYFIEQVKALGIPVQIGQFGADMQIDAHLDGPVTILVEA